MSEAAAGTEYRTDHRTENETEHRKEHRTEYITEYRTEHRTECRTAHRTDRSGLSIRLINYERHRAELEYLPCIPVEDLAVVFYQAGRENGRKIWRPVTLEAMEEWKVSIGMLYREALQTSVRCRPAKLDTLTHAIGLDPDPETEGPDASMPELYVLSNRKGQYGAAVLLYPGELRRIAMKWQEGFYIIPSSVHEVILVPESQMIPLRDMVQIVREINRTELAPEEILSDEIYHYSLAGDRFRRVESIAETVPGPLQEADLAVECGQTLKSRVD